MKVKFMNGVIKECSAPTEQKLFKNKDGETVSAGWLLMLRLTGNITSTELDDTLTPTNVESLDFLSDDECETLFTLDGYSKITSSSIRHAEETSGTFAEIQITKGV